MRERCSDGQYVLCLYVMNQGSVVMARDDGKAGGVEASVIEKTGS